MALPDAIQSLLCEGRLTEVLPPLQNHVEAHPDDREAGLELARVLLGLQGYDEASAQLSALLEATPEDAAAIGVRGVWHECEGRLTEAKSDYQQSLQGLPDQPAICYNLGRLLVHQDELSDADAQRAEAHLTHALSLEHDHFQALFELATLYTRRNEPVKALEAARKVIEINPYHLKAYLFVGEMFTYAGKVDEVISLYKAGLQLNPLAHAFRDELIRLYKQQQAYTAAFDVALEQSRTRGAYEDFLELGSLALLENQPRIAEIAFVKGEEVNAEDWRAPYNLGELYRGASLDEQADAAFQRSLALQDTPQAHTGRALLHFETEDEAQQLEVQQHLQQAFDLAPENPGHLLNLGLFLQRLGKLDEHYERALKAAEAVIPATDPSLQKAKALVQA